VDVASDPSQLEDRLLLPNRNAVRIRPLQRSDEGLIGRFYRRLSPRTRYLRFWSSMPDPPESLLRLITSVDGCRRLALIAASDVDGTDIVALSEFAALDDRTAEIGLVVCDEWQRRGLGSALVMRTLCAAEARGFDRFVAEVLVYNAGMRRLLDRVGVVVSRRTTCSASTVTFVRRQS
jgi:acetyltransferase